MKIANVDLKGAGDHLILNVTAIAPTFGWTEVNLSIVQYITPPEDGLQDIILLATPPAGQAQTSIQIFELSVDLATNDWYHGVRISDTSGNQIWSLRSPTLGKEPIGASPFSIELAEIKEDKLFINIRYGGGCKTHLFQLNWDGNTMESFPPQLVLELSHNSNGDTCRALLFEALQFDLSTLEGFPKENVRVMLRAPGNTIELFYNSNQDNTLKLSSTPEIVISETGNALNSLLPKIERGYSNDYDLGEAIRDAISKLPNRAIDIVDFLSTYRVVNIGSEMGGIGGSNRLFVDLEG